MNESDPTLTLATRGTTDERRCRPGEIDPERRPPSIPSAGRVRGGARGGSLATGGNWQGRLAGLDRTGFRATPRKRVLSRGDGPHRRGVADRSAPRLARCREEPRCEREE